MDVPDIANDSTKPMIASDRLENVQLLLNTFEQQLTAGLDHLSSEARFEPYLKASAGIALGLLELGTKIGGQGAQQLAEVPVSTKDWEREIPAFLFSYHWPETLKSFFLLWRDVLVEGNQALIQTREEQGDVDLLTRLKDKSIATLGSYWKKLSADLLDLEQKIRRSPAEYKIQWDHQHNPWPTYEEQLQTISQQISDLHEQQGLMAQANIAYVNIRQLVNETIGLCGEQLHKVHQHSQQTIDYIQENETEKPQVLKAKIEDVQQLVNFPHRLDSFLSQLETHLDGLPEKINVAVGNNDKQLVVKEIPFRRISRQWIESEILPLLYEFWEIIDRANNGMQVSLLNINNRLALLEKDFSEENAQVNSGKNLCQPLQVFLENAESQSTRLVTLQAKIEKLLQRQFKISKAFDNQLYFLPAVYSVNQLRLNQNEFFQTIIDWWNKRKENIRQFRYSVEREEALSHSEKVARALEQRAGDPKNIQYNNIFLTKGYLGESFVVGRKEEFAHVAKLIDQWEAGFRGAILLKGSRFCGKTLFGEMVANKFFHRKTIRIQPNDFIQIDGRRLATKFDLQEALEFVKKHTLNQKPLIWIDDMELWSDPAFALGRNIRVLEQFISDNSGRIFFMVSTSVALNMHLEKTYRIKNSFQAIIELDKMDTHEIKDAILIRHGATHKKLVTQDGGTVSSGQFNKMMDRVLKLADGNIGEAFFKWSMHVDLLDAEHVHFQEHRHYYLPPFLNADNGILLAAIHMEKYTNEYRLRKLFGPAFKERYAAVLQRLLRTKVLMRRTDGWLSINDLLVNEVVEMLAEDQYLLN